MMVQAAVAVASMPRQPSHRSGQDAAPVAGQGTGVVSPEGSLCSTLRQGSTVVQVTASLLTLAARPRPDRT